MIIKSKYEMDPIEITGGASQLTLRIGGHGQGEGREARLSPSQAQLVAYALLAEATRLTAPAPQT